MKKNTFCSLVGFEEKLVIHWIDFNIGYDYDLKRCIDFLNQTADRFDQCERKIVQQAHAFG